MTTEAELLEKIKVLEQEKLARDIKFTTESLVGNSAKRMVLLPLVSNVDVPIFLRKEIAKYIASSYKEYAEDLIAAIEVAKS